MNYSNGFDVDLVLPALKGRRGWRQSDCVTLDAENTKCTSGRYFEDAHALVTVKNLHETQEHGCIDAYSFNEYLSGKQKSVIMKALNTVFGEPEKLQQLFLFDSVDHNNEQLIENTGLVKGWFFEIAKDFGITHQLTQVSLYFNEDVTFTLYLFKQGRKTPVSTMEVSAVAYERNIVSIEAMFLNLAKDTPGTKYFLCYLQTDLGTAKAIKEDACFAKTLCFRAMPFSSTTTGDINDFDRVGFSEGFDTNGINLEVISFRDHTQRIIRNANLFDEVIGLEMATDVIEQQVYSTRSNSTERITGEKSQQVFSELNQAFGSQELPFVPGLKARITKEYKRLKETFFPKPKAQNVNLACYVD